MKEGESNLPYQGAEVSIRTDESGRAHVEVTLEPGIEFIIKNYEHGGVSHRVSPIKETPNFDTVISEGEEDPARIEHPSGMVLDTKSGFLTLPDGQIKETTPAETKILEVMMSSPSKIISPGKLADVLGYRLADRDGSSVTKPHILRIRKKIDPPGTPIKDSLIQTHRGFGWGIRGKDNSDLSNGPSTAN